MTEHNINLANLSVNPLTSLADGDLQNLTARFVRASSTGAPSSYPVTRVTSVLESGGSATAQVRIDGRLYNTPVSFLWEPGSVHDIDIPASFPIIGDRSLRSFRSWNDGGERVRQVVAGDQAATYTATYGIQYGLFPATVGPGRIDLVPSSTTFYFDRDSNVELNATTNEGNQFVGWGNDLGGNQNPRTVTMRESMEPIAFFGSTSAVSNFGVMNAARQRPNTQITGTSIFAKISPGELVTINMPGVGPEMPANAMPDQNGVISTRLNEVRALVGNVAVPVLSVAKGQFTAYIPQGAAVLVGRSAGVQIEYQGRQTGAGGVAVVVANPAIYTANGSGSGQAQLTNEDGKANGPNDPARRGSVVTFLAGGLGVTSPAAPDRVSANLGAPPAGELEVRIGGAVAEVVSAGIAPGQLGVYRIEARVPDSARVSGATSLIITLDGVPSQFDVTMAVEPARTN